MKFCDLPEGFLGWIVSEGNTYLIGDLNQLGGVCNDCPGIRYDADIEILREVSLELEAKP